MIEFRELIGAIDVELKQTSLSTGQRTLLTAAREYIDNLEDRLSKLEKAASAEKNKIKFV